VVHFWRSASKTGDAKALEVEALTHPCRSTPSPYSTPTNPGRPERGKVSIRHASGIRHLGGGIAHHGEEILAVADTASVTVM